MTCTILAGYNASRTIACWWCRARETLASRGTCSRDSHRAAYRGWTTRPAGCGSRQGSVLPEEGRIGDLAALFADGVLLDVSAGLRHPLLLPVSERVGLAVAKGEAVR
eukprot:scaffold140188_cov33-Prasinocladus_malaysianus.AAC.2